MPAAASPEATDRPMTAADVGRRRALAMVDEFAHWLLTVTHILVKKIHDHLRLRRPVHWSIADLPDDDAVLARLAAGIVFRGLGGRA